MQSFFCIHQKMTRGVKDEYKKALQNIINYDNVFKHWW